MYVGTFIDCSFFTVCKFFYFVHRFREFYECFVVFFYKHIFFMGQLSVFATAAIRRSLSSRSIPHSSSMCSAV